MPLPHDVAPVLTQPHLVIEIVSPDDEASAMLQKVTDYGKLASFRRSIRPARRAREL